MTPECLAGALFTAALLSTRKDLNHRVRSLMVSHAPSFDIHSLADTAAALTTAFREAGVSPQPRPRLRSDTFRAALKAADQWIRSGVFVLSREDIKSPEMWVHDLPPVFFALGNKAVLDRPASAILNSRKPRCMTPDDEWLQETKRLVRLAVEEGFAIVSSYGTTPYCTVSRLSKGSPTIIVCDDVLPSMGPEKTTLEFFSAYRDLFQFERTLFISSFPPGARPRSGVRSAERDHLVAALATVLFVAEVRDGGNMQQVLHIAEKRGVRIVGYPSSSSYRPALTASKKSEAIPVVPPVAEQSRGNMLQSDRQTPRPRATRSGHIRLESLYDLGDESPWLIHYTRSCPGPWPGQTIADYCQSLIEGSEGACHSAFDTLIRILKERMIRASSRLTRGSYDVVSFSECLPAEIDTQIRWRKGLSRWSFEPYGIAFPRESLTDLGAGHVVYGSREDFQHLRADEKHLFQARGSSSSDWTTEREWRIRGDFLLSDAICQEMVVIVPALDEAAVVALKFACQVTLAGIVSKRGVRRF